MNINSGFKLFLFDKKEKNSYKFILGCDEAGRGPAAGGVWASCVCFFNNTDISLFSSLNDSKKLTPKKRDELFDKIIENSYYSIKTVDIDIIEKINILNASLYAMKLAALDVINQIRENDILLLIDGNKLIPDFNINQKFIIKGDSISASIAASSILAKVSRDKFMDKIHLEYPHYRWDKNKGYLTKDHIEAIKKYGVTKYHRKSFLKNIIKASGNNSEA